MKKNNKLSPSQFLSTALSCIALLCIASFAVAENTDQASEQPWYERSFEQLLDTKIITPTRDTQSLRNSAAAISVYTANDIKRMGIRTVKELLERTTGFFVNKQLAGAAIGSRGYIGDNEQFLLLIDGHNANSIVDKGPGFFFLFPMLENVKRVEIVRGPGSTLWGSDAALGIIHIITKDGTDIDGPVATYSYATEDRYRYANVQAGEKLAEDISYIVSFTGAKAEGFPEDGVDPFWPGRWEQIDDSWELYFTAQLRNTTVHTRAADLKNSNPSMNVFQATNLDQPPYYRRRHIYLDIEHSRAISNSLSLELRVFTDLMERWQKLRNMINSKGISTVMESAASKENALGLELLGKWRPHSQHALLFGLRAVRTEIDPVTNNVSYPSTSEPPSAGTVFNLRVVPEDIDENIAVFIEDDWRISKDINSTLGLRLDRNNLREKNTIVLPRLGINWQFAPSWSSHYSYNTGYIRPPVGIGFLGQETFNTFTNDNSEEYTALIYGASDSEKVYSHDLQLQFKRNPLIANLALFHTQIDDAFNFLFQADSADDPTRILFFINTNTIKSYGYELSFQYLPISEWDFYGNLSHVLQAKVDKLTGSEAGIDYDFFNDFTPFAPDGTVAAYPQQIWNLGLNYQHKDTLTLNLHYRGWSDMHMSENFTNRKISFGPEHFFDLNIVFNKLLGTQLNVALFAKNLLDNDDSEIAMLLFRNEWSERGRSMGIKLDYQF